MKILEKAIVANIEAMSQMLNQAASLAEEAKTAMAASEQNQAIGTILPLEELLANAAALYKAALALHQQK